MTLLGFNLVRGRNKQKKTIISTDTMQSVTGHCGATHKILAVNFLFNRRLFRFAFLIILLTRRLTDDFFDQLLLFHKRECQRTAVKASRAKLLAMMMMMTGNW